MRLFAALFLLMGLSCRICSAQESMLVEVYSLPTADREEIVEIVKLLAGEKGTVTVDKPRDRVIVVATEAQQKQVAKLLQQVNIQPRNVQLEVSINTVGNQSASGFGADISGTANLAGKNPDIKATIKPYATQQAGKMDSATRQLILVSSGREAALRMGADVPFTDWLISLGRNWGYIQQHTITKFVGAKLLIQPTIIGNGPYISLKLTPEVSVIAGGRRQTVRFVRVTTQITVQDGYTTTFAGMGKSADFYKRFLTGFNKTSYSSSTVLTVTPHIMNVSAQRPPQRTKPPLSPRNKKK